MAIECACCVSNTPANGEIWAFSPLLPRFPSDWLFGLVLLLLLLLMLLLLPFLLLLILLLLILLLLELFS